MKYCPNCGAELPDEANFCPKCGAKQPDAQVEKAVEQPAQAPVAQTPNQEASPRQRYNDLVKNDELFKEIVNVRKKKYLFELICAAFFITWLVAMFVPVAKLTGNEMSAEGAYILSGLGITLPHEFGPYDLIELDTLSGNKALTPGGLNSVYAVMMMIIGIILLVLSIGFPFIKAFTGRSYVLKQYEEGKVKELINESTKPFIVGSLFNIIVLVPSINLFIATNDINYVYKDSSRYIFGEMESIPSGFIAVIIVSLIMTALVLAASIVICKLLSRKLRELAKNI